MRVFFRLYSRSCWCFSICFADAAAGNAEGLGKGPFRGQFVPVAEMAFRHELPEAFRELLIAPARTPGGRVCFGHDAFLTELVRPI